MPTLLPPRSTARRQSALEGAGARVWDLVVVGGGITGVAVAREAAARGLATLLLEQDDLASGTSSRSSRLIHGGLRYLANLELGLVREGLLERARLLAAAPGLVRAVSFLYPVYGNDPDRLWRIRLGVRLYRLLALGHALGSDRALPPGRVLSLVPGLRGDGLEGAVAYLDGATHDSRLTIGVARAARAAGATILTRVRVTGSLEGRGGVEIQADDRVGGAPIRLRSAAAALCCGPWRDLLAGAALSLRTARGSHIALDRSRLPVDHHLAIRSPVDGRLTFILPAFDHVVVGTTDADDLTEPAVAAATPADVSYLLATANHAFPGAGLGPAEVTGVWAGLRPLLAGDTNDDPDELSRRHRVVSAGRHTWVVAGGKLTTHGRMARDCLERVLRDGPHARPRGRQPSVRAAPLLPGSLEDGRRALGALGVEPRRVAGLEALYGTRLERLAAAMAAGPAGEPEDRLLAAQVALAADEEWALALDDLLLRRLLPGPLDLRACAAAAPRAAELLGNRLGWTPAEREAQVEAFRALVAGVLETAGLAAS